MGGKVNLARLALLAGVLTISGCGFIRPVDLGESTHTMQELCDFPKPFFAKQFNATNLKTSSVTSTPMSKKIGLGESCFYETPTEYLGYVALRQEPKQSAVEGRLARHISVDGASVDQYVDPIPTNRNHRTTQPSYTLTATIDGWYGELHYNLGNDAGTQAGAETLQAGAETLVGMVRALKGQPLPSKARRIFGWPW
ncbi:hypothetical protein AB0L63_30860 [Nocardia sp. NPDC051990]|uniref:hypothetical protein n=1 Tax=Nocardia sp. NPDC051990 TaxID=3155285 RepID=UPI0034393F4B